MQTTKPEIHGKLDAHPGVQTSIEKILDLIARPRFGGIENDSRDRGLAGTPVPCLPRLSRKERREPRFRWPPGPVANLVMATIPPIIGLNNLATPPVH